jgi:hypothetical protein
VRAVPISRQYVDGLPGLRWRKLRAIRKSLSLPVGTAEGFEEDQQQAAVESVSRQITLSVPVLVYRPGPRIVEGLELLARAIHPEVFTGESQKEKP